jgi:hypothetical protein
VQLLAAGLGALGLPAGVKACQAIVRLLQQRRAAVESNESGLFAQHGANCAMAAQPDTPLLANAAHALLPPVPPLLLITAVLPTTFGEERPI